MSNQQPLVSVMIRTRNRIGYLKIAVESVLNQTFQNWELTISDDASTDDTSALGHQLEQQNTRIKYIRHDPALGASDNWRYCLAHSRGKYFAALDDDNRYLPHFLEKAVIAFESVPGVSFAFSDEWRINAVGERDEHSTDTASAHYHRTGLSAGICKDTALISVQQAPGINSALFDRKALVEAGGFRQLAGDLADFDMFLNLAFQGHQAVYIAERLVEYRQHGDQDGGTYLRSVQKARSSISILESVSFQGLAEQERLGKLAQSYISLGRTLLLNGDVQSARDAIRHSLKIRPRHPKTVALAGLLNLPEPLIQYGLLLLYGQRGVIENPQAG